MSIPPSQRREYQRILIKKRAMYHRRINKLQAEIRERQREIDACEHEVRLIDESLHWLNH